MKVNLVYVEGGTNDNEFQRGTSASYSDRPAPPPGPPNYSVYRRDVAFAELDSP